MRNILNNIPEGFLNCEPEQLPLDQKEYPEIFNEVWQNMYKQLVPDSGNCKSVAGEVMRAVSKIEYRFFNDGDTVNESGVYYKGIAVNAFNYLTQVFTSLKYGGWDYHIGSVYQVRDSLQVLLEDADNPRYYRLTLMDLKICIMKTILESINYPNDKDCTDEWELTDLDSFNTLEHTYEK